MFNVVYSCPYLETEITTYDNYDKALEYFIEECKSYGITYESDLSIMKKKTKNIGYIFSFHGRKHEFNFCIQPTPYNSDKEYIKKLEEIKVLINEE